MSLDQILQALDVEAAAEIAAIEQAAEVEIARVRAEAEVRIAVAQQKHRPAIEPTLRAERARILNQAKLEALRTVMGTREELIRAALEAAVDRLAVLPDDETYARALEGLIGEAASALNPAGRLHLRVESRDLSMVAGIVQRRGLQAIVEEGVTVDGVTWNCSGGVVVMSEDGRTILVNTLSARLQRVATLYHSEIANLLFSETERVPRINLSPGD